MHAKKHSPRGLLLILDAIVVFLFLLCIMQPFLLQTALMRIHASERAADDASVSLLMQLSQQLYNTGAALHLKSNTLLAPQNYTQVGYYDSNWKSNQNNALPALAELNLSSAVLDAPPPSLSPPPSSSSERICLSRLMATESGTVHALRICDN